MRPTIVGVIVALVAGATLFGGMALLLETDRWIELPGRWCSFDQQFDPINQRVACFREWSVVAIPVIAAALAWLAIQWQVRKAEAQAERALRASVLLDNQGLIDEIRKVELDLWYDAHIPGHKRPRLQARDREWPDNAGEFVRRCLSYHQASQEFSHLIAEMKYLVKQEDGLKSRLADATDRPTTGDDYSEAIRELTDLERKITEISGKIPGRAKLACEAVIMLRHGLERGLLPVELKPLSIRQLRRQVYSLPQIINTEFIAHDDAVDTADR